MSTGEPVRWCQAASRACRNGVFTGSTVCSRALPSTWVIPGSSARYSGRTSAAYCMNGAGRSTSKIRAACSASTSGASGRNHSRPFTSKLM